MLSPLPRNKRAKNPHKSGEPDVLAAEALNSHGPLIRVVPAPVAPPSKPAPATQPAAPGFANNPFDKLDLSLSQAQTPQAASGS